MLLTMNCAEAVLPGHGLRYVLLPSGPLATDRAVQQPLLTALRPEGQWPSYLSQLTFVAFDLKATRPELRSGMPRRC